MVVRTAQGNRGQGRRSRPPAARPVAVGPTRCRPPIGHRHPHACQRIPFAPRAPDSAGLASSRRDGDHAQPGLATRRPPPGRRRSSTSWPPRQPRTIVAARPPVATRTGHRTAARRSAVVGVFTVLLAACAVWVQGGGGRTGSGPLAAPGAGRTETAAVHVWIVQPGDTLWGIARRLDPNGDVRPLVDALSKQVHGRPLQVGEQLRLP